MTAASNLFAGAKAAAAARPEPDTDAQPAAPSELEVLKSRAKLMGIHFSNNIKVETLREKIQAKLDDEADAEEENKGDNPDADDDGDDDTTDETGGPNEVDEAVDVPALDTNAERLLQDRDSARNQEPFKDAADPAPIVASNVAVVAPAPVGAPASGDPMETLRALAAQMGLQLVPTGSNGPSLAPAPAPVDKALTRKETIQQTREKILAEEMKLVRCRITNLDPKKKDLPGEILTVANEFIGTVRKYIPYGEVTDGGYHIPNVLYKQLKDRTFTNIKVRKDDRGREIVETQDAREFSIEVLPPLTTEELGRLAAAQAAADGA